MTCYTGPGVSLRSVSIGIVNDHGQAQREAKADKTVDSLCGFSNDVSIFGFEAATLTQYLTHGLQQAGFEVICREACQVKAAQSAMRKKTDRNDARGIAKILRTGWYSPVHGKSMESHT